MNPQQVAKVAELMKTAKKVERYDLYDKILISSGGVSSKYTLFTQGEGTGQDVAGPVGAVKTRFTTNLQGDATVPENEVIVLTRMYKVYDTLYTTPIVFPYVAPVNTDREGLLGDIRSFEAGIGGDAPFLTITRGGNQDKFLDLPLNQVPSAHTISNQAENTQDVKNVYSFTDKAPLVLFDRLRFQVVIECTLTATAPVNNLILGIVFQGFRFRPMLPEGVGEGKLADLLTAIK